MIKYHERDYGSIVTNKFRDYLWGDKQVAESTVDAYCISVRAFCDFTGIFDEDAVKTIDGKMVRNFVEHLRHDEYENGKNVLVTYLDENKNPMITRLGYAILRRTFYETDPWTGKVENEFYFDESDQPIALSLGQYGVHKEYDEFGRNNVLMYLDVDGQPMITEAGYTTVKRTFYPDDTVKTEMYFDLEDNPIALSQGQYGVLRENGATVFLDANGYPQFNLRNWLYANPISVVLIALVVVAASMMLSRKANWFLLVLYIVSAFR